MAEREQTDRKDLEKVEKQDLEKVEGGYSAGSFLSGANQRAKQLARLARDAQRLGNSVNQGLIDNLP